MVAKKQEEEEVYEVEKIADHRIKTVGSGKKAQKELQYNIKWKDFSSSDNTWEDSESVDAPELIEEYWSKHGNNKALDAIKKEIKSFNQKPSSNSSGASKDSTSTTRSNKRLASFADDPVPNKRAKASASSKAKKDSSDIEHSVNEDFSDASSDDFSDDEVEPESFRANQPGWDKDILKVKRVEKKKSELYAIVRWTDGKLAKYKTSEVTRKAPQQLIEYYEERLLFEIKVRKQLDNAKN